VVADHQGRERQGGISRFVADMLERDAVKLPRRQFLHLAAGAAALTAVSRIASAQAYPTRPVRIIVGFAAGGGYDIIARLIGQWLSERLGQPFVIENRPGAATNIATQVVVNAAPDGYTLLLIGPTNTINTTFYRNLHFDFIRKVNASSPGVGSISHLALELFKMMAGVKLAHVPFGGNGPALTALFGGQVEVSVASLPSSIESIRTGKLHGLAVTTAMRAEALPDVPAVGEFVSGYEVSAWYGMGTPTGTPPEVIDKINKEINAGLADTKLKARIADFGGTPFALSPAQFGKFIAEETEKWRKVIRAANIKPV